MAAAVAARELSTAARKLLGTTLVQWIGGRAVPSATGRALPVLNPATGRTFAEIADGDAADVDAAVKAARSAFRGKVWANADPAHRGRVLWELGRLIRHHLEPLAEIETWDSGKPIIEARADMVGTAEILEYYAGLSSKLYGQTAPVPGGQLAMVLREPVGVVGLITPWNFPLYVAAWKFAPALCTGNSIVLKPSELTSLSALVAARLASEAGIPDGVFNIVCGTGDRAGAALSAHDDVDVLGFTGGPVTAKKILRQRAELVRPTQLELGGKSPNIVFEDADLPSAVAGAAFGIFFNQGENCNAGSRLLVHHSVYDAFLEQLTTTARGIRVLPPMDEQSQMGALISSAHREKVHAYVQKGLEQGARLLTGGSFVTGPEFDGGYFYSPTILADVKPTDVVFNEEIFGPVVTVTPFATDDEALSLANATEFGLAAGVWTASVDRAVRFVREIQAGYVWVNTYNCTPVEVPFGGQKGSGFGRDCGLQAIETYTTWKSGMWATSKFQPWYQ